MRSLAAAGGALLVLSALAQESPPLPVAPSAQQSPQASSATLTQESPQAPVVPVAQQNSQPPVDPSIPESPQPSPEPFMWEGPGLGIPATPQELAAWDISIQPDGEGLPPGSGTAAAGASVYTLHCFSCHGAKGEGQLNDVLVGGHGSLGGPAPRKTVGSYWPYATTLFDYIRRSMPYQQPHSLSDGEVYALTAYLLYLNGIIEEHQPMDAKSLPAVRMPNRDNFILAYPRESAAVQGGR